MIVDAGARVAATDSDCTRTFAAGDVPPQLLEIYDVCLRAQLAGLAAVRAGVTAHDADAAAREPSPTPATASSSGTGSATASGWRCTRRPACGPRARRCSPAGNVVTVEPGIYLPGVGGVRIEDLVVVTDGGRRS